MAMLVITRWYIEVWLDPYVKHIVAQHFLISTKVRHCGGHRWFLALLLGMVDRW